jgi:putative FmdB family regulatory protein
MPQYDFVCQDCKKPFSKILTVAEYEKGRIVCPKCGSRKVEQQASPFYAVTSQEIPSQNRASRENVNLSASEEDDRARVLSDWEGEGGTSGTGKGGG